MYHNSVLNGDVFNLYATEHRLDISWYDFLEIMQFSQNFDQSIVVICESQSA